MLAHLISLMIFFPFAGAVAQAFTRGSSPSGVVWSRWLAFFCSVFSSILGIFLVSTLNSEIDQWGGLSSHRETLNWIGSYSITYDVRVDGLSALYVLLISLIFPVLIFSEWRVEREAKGIHSLFLLLQSSLLGVVCSHDLFLIFFFWSLTVLPLYFLLSIWGGKASEAAAFRFVVTSSIGNALFFVSILLIYFSIEPHTFSLGELIYPNTNSSVFFDLSLPIVTLAFVLFSIGVALRLPVFPIHGWFTFFIREAPTSVSVAFCGVFVPVGIYVFSRLAYSLFPDQMIQHSDVLMILGSVNVLIGAMSTVSQRDLRMFLAYLCMAGMGVLVMGLGSLKDMGVVGTTFQGLALGMGLSSFGLICGLLIERARRSVFINESGEPEMGGLITKLPALALVSAIVFASLLGFPALGGFVGQSLITMGGFMVNPAIVVVLALGLVLMTYSLFSLYRNVFLGEHNEHRKNNTNAFSDLSVKERGFLVPLVVIILFIGIYPKPLLELVKPAVYVLLSATR